MTAQLAAPAPIEAEQAMHRAGIALAFVAMFLALEPPFRTLLWWLLSDMSVKASLHSDVSWLAVGLLACTGIPLYRDVRERVLSRGWLLLLGLVWVVAATLSSTMIENRNPGSSTRWPVYLVFGLYLLSALQRAPELAGRLLVASTAGFTGLAIVLAAFIGFSTLPVTFDWVAELPGAFNVRSLGYEAIVAALVGSLYRPAAARPYVLVLLRTGGVIGWAFIFWSGGRGALISALAAVLAVHLLSTTEQRWKRLAETACLVMAGAALSLLHIPANESFGFWRTIGLTSASAPSLNQDISTGRTAIWKEAASAILTHPLLGIGEAQMKYQLASAVGRYPQPHNLLLQAPLAWGIPGGLAFLAAVALPIIRGAKRLRHHATLGSPAVAGFSIALAMAANSLLDGTLFHPRPVTMFLIGACLALAAPLGRQRAR